MMNFRKKLLATIAVLGVFSASAYEKMSVSTQAFLDNRAAFPAQTQRHAALRQVGAQEMVDVFITLRDTGNTSGITALGGKVGARFSGMITAQVPVGSLEAIAALPEVEQVSIGEQMVADTDSTRAQAGVEYAWEGLRHNLPANYDGTGVVFGIVDSGIDFNHAAFQDSLGNTRIKRVYMPGNTTGTQVIIGGTALPGSEFDSTRIAQLTTDYASSSHGTHTASIGVGTKVGAYSGMAPGADIVICALGNSSTDVNMANSLKYITNYAKSVGKPCVISVSIGTKKGPHDGTSKICKIYDEVGQNDAIICLSAGNLGGVARQLHHKFSGANTSTSPTFGSVVMGNMAAGTVASFSIDTWSRTRSVVGIKYILIDPDDNSIFYETGIMKAYTYHYIGPGTELKRGHNAFLSKYFSGKIGVWVTTESNGHNETYSEVTLKPLNDSVKNYKVAVQFYGANGVEFDSWMNSEHYFGWHKPVGNYLFTPGNDSCSVNDNVTGQYTISCGNYVGRNSYPCLQTGSILTQSHLKVGNIYSSSSYARAPNGKTYPFVAAPGTNVLAAVNGYNHLASINNPYSAYRRENPHTGRLEYWGASTGTSMSAPTVAGIVALWLQARPSLKVGDVKDIISKSAFVDDDVRQSPIRFGAGKINALGGFPEFQYRLTDILTNQRLSANRYYSIADSTLTCMRLSADGRTIFAKADSPYARQDSIAPGQVDYIKAQGLMAASQPYDQSNWLLLHLPQAIDSTQRTAFVGRRLRNVGGMLRSKTNLEMDADKMPAAIAADSIASPVFNTFIPANFHGSQQVDSLDYFFVKPKPMEVDTIRGAYWNASLSRLEMPQNATVPFQGSASVDFSLVDKASETFVVNSHYDFVGLTMWDESGNPVVYPLEIIAEKVGENTFAEILSTPAFKEGYSYVVADTTLRVMHVSASGRTIYVKDNGGFATPDTIAPGQVNYLGRDLDQSNWAALHLPAPLDSAQRATYPGKIMKRFRGRLDSKDNASFTLFNLPLLADSAVSVSFNAIIPANLHGSQQVDSVDYFFVRPKPMEIDTIHNVMWNGVHKQIGMPINPDRYGMPRFSGTASADLSLYEGADSVSLTDNYVYDMLVLSTINPLDGTRMAYPLAAWNERKNQFTLAQVVNDAYFKEGMDCEMMDSTLVVMYGRVGDKEIYVKDDHAYAQPDVLKEGQVDVLGGVYDQSNWMKLALPAPLDSAQHAALVGSRIAAVKGVLASKTNPTLQCAALPVALAKDSVLRFNTFIPANFYGTQKVDTTDYFFVKPKPMEIDTVRCAMWNVMRGNVTMPYFPEEYGFKAFRGSFSVDFSKLTGALPSLRDADVLTMVVLNVAGSSMVYPLEILDVKSTEFTLAKLVNSPSIQLGYEFGIADSTLTVMGFSTDGYAMYVKDEGLYASPDVPDSTQVNYQGALDQSNWATVYLPEQIDSEVARSLTGRYITNFRGYLMDKDNPEFEIYEMPQFGELNIAASLNHLIPANFTGSEVVDSTDYFLMRPKPMEVAIVQSAMWNKKEERFEMPYEAADFGHPQFKGGFTPQFSFFDGDKSLLKDGYVYELRVQSRFSRMSNMGYVLNVVSEQRPDYALASVLGNERIEEGSTVPMRGGHLTVMHIGADSLTLYAKDEARAVKADTIAPGQIDYLAGRYQQHNWVAITLPAPLDSAQMAAYAGHRIEGFDAVIMSKQNATLQALTVPTVGALDSTAFINSYLPANFHGTQQVDSLHYFLARPVVMEIDTVHCALWRSSGKFSMPKKPAEWGLPQLKGEFSADVSRLAAADTVVLRDNYVYDIVTLREADAVYVLKVLRELGGTDPMLGDVNDDGLLDVTDVTLLISAVLGTPAEEFCPDRADINADGELDVTDVTLLIGIVLGQ
ncbi:MAG: S8 family serine peptidase [Bacteroidales bacterium]|nr:S8 family serine peptidase [Bacteroidales bacterium]